jgi:hypothetical protein
MEDQPWKTRSGKSYGPLKPEKIQEIAEIIDQVQTALGPSDPQGSKDLEKTRRLLRRLGNMLHLSRESEYWNIVLPAMSKRLRERLWEIDEFWSATVNRNLTSIINEFQSS